MIEPAAKRETLVLVAGIVWSLVGLALIAVAVVWMLDSPRSAALPVPIGIVGGYVVYRFGFSGLVRRNLVRIYAQAPHKDKVCVFAFQNVRSYFIVIIMMAMGYGLRHSGLPKVYLAAIYFAIGFTLVLSSFLYYNRLRISH
jgi:hypothetical protein